MLSSKNTEINFGTSGLRAHADCFNLDNISAYVDAFLDLLSDGEKNVYVGADFRTSSPHIAVSVISAINANGWQAVYGGNVPTPALALYALKRNCPAIMITGSHIPENYNGIKFYKREGELLKSNEEPIREKAALHLNKGIKDPLLPLPNVNDEIAKEYVARFTLAFAKDALKGLKIGVDLHSAVGRDLTVKIMQELGATCFPFNHSKEFIALDREALNKEDITRAKAQLKKHQRDAIISTDGDGDRPLLLDENGDQINGDVIGAICAKSLDINIVVTPLSSTSAIEKTGWFEKTVRTKIGSPHAVFAMEQEQGSGKNIAGFEAKGGFLLASDLTQANGTISKLPTRDAILPLICVLAEAAKRKIAISDLLKDFPERFMQAEKIKNISNENAQVFLSSIMTSSSTRADVHIHIKQPEKIDNLDGVRMSLSDGSIVHFRQSGNAPEMRIYVETTKKSSTNNMLSEITKGLKEYLNQKSLLNE